MSGSPDHVLVTGAGGFIGGHIVRRFAAQGWKVSGLVHRRQPKAPVPGVDYVTGDISDAASLRPANTMGDYPASPQQQEENAMRNRRALSGEPPVPQPAEPNAVNERKSRKANRFMGKTPSN